MSIAADNWSRLRLSYGITPPKLSFPEERRRQTAAAQSERVSSLPIDALVVYDLQDESSRTDATRPFPFLQTVDPIEYAYDYLAEVSKPKIVYRSVTTMSADKLRRFLGRLRSESGATVLVGAPSQSLSVGFGLGDAYRLVAAEAPLVPLGGVAIAERHETRGGEDERILRKRERGCSFFISQAVYSVSASKNLLSDLYYRCEESDQMVPPFLVTLSPCGSKKTLEFMAWLGVSIPRWLENELLHAHDILEKSVQLSLSAFTELYEFAQEKGIPLGCNVESVSLNRAEIEASVEMVHRVCRIMGREATSGEASSR